MSPIGYFICIFLVFCEDVAELISYCKLIPDRNVFEFQDFCNLILHFAFNGDFKALQFLCDDFIIPVNLYGTIQDFVLYEIIQGIH